MSKKNKNVLIKFTKGEKFLISSSVFLVLLLILVEVFCGTTQSNLSINVEKIKYEITTQEKVNESLAMQVNELTSYDTIKDIVKDMGLAYNNENIIVISK